MPPGAELRELSEVLPYAVVLGGVDRWLDAIVATELLAIDVHGSGDTAAVHMKGRFTSRRSGRSVVTEVVELVTVRVTGTVPGPEIGAVAPPGIPKTVTGPEVVDLGESTLVVPAGWSGESDERGTLWLVS